MLSQCDQKRSRVSFISVFLQHLSHNKNCVSYHLHCTFQQTLLLCSSHTPQANGSYWATVCKMVHPMLLDHCLSCPVCLSVTLVHCGQMVGWIKMALGSWYAGRPQPRPHRVRWRPSSHAERGTVAPLSKFKGTGFAYVCIICGPCLLSPNGLIHQDALGTEIGLGPCHIVLDLSLIHISEPTRPY